jgi:peptidoglycan/LPS O-acetylase OafA/YrhL
MGLFRLLLACAVVISHAWGMRSPSIPAVWGPLAVQMFFVISGFYMTVILTTKYLHLERGIARFYLNRALRLMPTYWVALAGLIVGALLLRPTDLPVPLSWWTETSHFTSQPATFGALIFSHLTLIAHDVLPFLPNIGERTAEDYVVIKPAWSIGMELWFYLAAPWLVRLRSRTLVLLILPGLALHCWTARLGFPWDQRIIFSQYMYFLFGILAFRMKDAAIYRHPAAGPAALATAAFLSVCGRWIDLGVVAGPLFFTLVTAVITPALFALTKRSTVDRFIGDLSYPVYMTHFCVLYLYAVSPTWYGLDALAITLAVSVAIVLLVEMPIETVRQRVALAAEPGRVPKASYG